MAMEAPPETLAYVAMLDHTRRRPDALAVVDVDPASKSYARTVGQVDMGRLAQHLGFHPALLYADPRQLIDSRAILETRRRAFDGSPRRMPGAGPSSSRDFVRSRASSRRCISFRLPISMPASRSRRSRRCSVSAASFAR
jgi:hypothetical protein